MDKPNFSILNKIKIPRFNSEDVYLLSPVRDLEVAKIHYESITNVCNEPEIHKWLFAPKKYNTKDAEEFISWATSIPTGPPP